MLTRSKTDLFLSLAVRAARAGLAAWLAFALGGAALSADEKTENSKSSSAGAESVARLPGPSGEDLKIYGTVKPGGGRMVWVRDAHGKHQAAKVFLESNSGYVVMLPNGRLVSRPLRECQACRLPFRGAGTKEIAEELKQDDYKDFTAKQSAHHVYVYNGSDEFTDRAATILETLHAGVYDYFFKKGFDVHPPECPLVVVIYKTEEQFRQMAGAPEGVLAFYSQLSNHIYLYETPKEGTPAPNAAKALVLTTVAHEGVHQTLHNIGVQERLASWPPFMTEGLAEYFAPTTGGENVAWAGVGQTNDFRWSRFKQIADSQTLPGSAQLVTSVVNARGLESDGYAVAWGLVHYLAQKKTTAFAKYMKAVSARKPLEEYYAGGKPSSNMAEFTEHFGKELHVLEAAMKTHVSGLTFRDPTRSDKHFIVAVEFFSGRKIVRDARGTVDPTKLDEIRLEMLNEYTVDEKRTAKFRYLEFNNKGEAQRWYSEYLSANGITRKQ